MKVYQIILKPRDTFCCYERDGFVTLETDKKYPYPRSTTGWNINSGYHDITPIINGVRQYNPRRIMGIITVLDRKHYQAFLQSELPLLIKTLCDFDVATYNIFILKKTLASEIEIRMFGIALKYQGSTYSFAQRIVDQHLKLKAFW